MTIDDGDAVHVPDPADLPSASDAPSDFVLDGHDPWDDVIAADPAGRGPTLHQHHGDHFDPARSVSAHIAGNPAEDITHWHEQATPFSCAVAVQDMILDAVSGRDYSESDLLHEAVERQWIERGGTPLLNIGKLLEQHGVPVHRTFSGTLTEVTDKLERGEKVMACVQADALDGPPALHHVPLSDYAGFPGQSGNHVVQVIGVDHTDPTDVRVILNDPARASGRGLMVSADTFERAWAPSGHFFVSTVLHNDSGDGPSKETSWHGRS